ncbi:MAG TPA: recombinase family protein [Symbiobacteriaceae bacterium]|nr:recombinase family protein [Symbiobacteriaceae bacterium]
MSLWAFYGRVSGIEQASNNSIPTQREACHERARERGAAEVLDFIDAGVPGDLDWTDRPALNQLLDLVEKGALQGVVVYDPDRLARDLGVQLAVTDIITKRQVHLEFITQQYDASPEGMLFYQLRGAISQFERAKIKERTNRGRKKLLREGIPANNPSPYGLRYLRETNSWEVIEEQAQTLRQIFGWASEGNGPSWIAQQLNAQGIPSPRGGKRWWVHVIQRILATPTYTGTLHIHQWNTEGQRKNRFLPPEKRHKASQRPKDEWVEVQVPRIIEPSLWEAVQAALGNNRRRWAGVESKHTYLASRLIRCGLCESAMTAATTKRGQRYYRCSGRYGERRLPCEMPHLRAADVDETIWEEIRAWLIAPERYEKAFERCQAAQKSSAERFSAGVAQQLSTVRSDIARLQELIDRGAVREHEVRGALKNLREKEAPLAAMLNAPSRPQVERFTAYDPAEVDNWDAITRREHIRGVVEQIVAFPDDRLEFYAREKTRLPKRA